MNVDFVLSAGHINHRRSYTVQAKGYPTTEKMELVMKKLDAVVARELPEAPRVREIHPAMMGMMEQGGAREGTDGGFRRGERRSRPFRPLRL